jgi:hypothetical protein
MKLIGELWGWPTGAADVAAGAVVVASAKITFRELKGVMKMAEHFTIVAVFGKRYRRRFGHLGFRRQVHA